MRLLQGAGQPDRVGDVEVGDEAVLRPGLSAQVLLPAERAHHGHAERPRELKSGYYYITVITSGKTVQTEIKDKLLSFVLFQVMTCKAPNSG